MAGRLGSVGHRDPAHAGVCTDCCRKTHPLPALQDWHRYNVKRRAAGQRPVSEAAFEALVEDEQAEVRWQLD